MTRRDALLALALAAALGGCRIAPNPDRGPVDAFGFGGDVAPLERYRVVDLTHGFDSNTVYWPTSETGFRLDTVAHGETPGGWFYSAYEISLPEHGGTHVDAPSHFHVAGPSVDEIPLERLIGPAIVIDLPAHARDDADYRLSGADIVAWEEEHGEIPEDAIVVLRTGWSRFWPQAERYLGGLDPADLHFPSFGESAARLLIEERDVAALGVDVASIDPGAAAEFPVHRLAAAARVPGLENLTNLGSVPPTGALIVALPMKIVGGSGAPLRAIALVPDVGS
ncbi:MAG: cyclase family protein [Longimicrobiales bacterium]